MSEKAKKNDSGKVSFNLMPWLALTEVAKVLQKGELKYPSIEKSDGYVQNWRVDGGMKWSRVSDAVFRHFISDSLGADYDDDPDGGTNQLHLACAAAGILFLLEYKLRGFSENDDRRKGQNEEILKNIHNLFKNIDGK